jgi:hypothetical protein
MCGCRYLVRRLLDGSLYALKHTDISALHRSEWTGVLNEVRLLASLQVRRQARWHQMSAGFLRRAALHWRLAWRWGGRSPPSVS